MKRPDGGTADTLYVCGSFVIDPVRGLLCQHGEIVPLTPKAFEVLVALVERRGTIVEKDVLLKLIWPNTVVEENNLARHISTLRKVFGEQLSEHNYIVTVPGRGYRFVATVQERTRGEEYGAAPALVSAAPVRNTQRPAGSVLGIAAGLVLIASFTGTQALLPRSNELAGLAHRKLWQLTFSPGVQGQPTWSPDGRWIAYSSDRAGNSDIWAQPIAQENPVRLTNSTANDWQPAWSPDDKYIAFRSERDGGGLFVVPARGGAERMISNFGYRPQWSPDGSTILFDGPLRSASIISTELYLVALDGTPPRAVLTGVLPNFRSFRARWHPDGQRISVYGVHRTAGPGFWIVSLNEQNVIQSAVSPQVAQHLKEADVTFTDFVWSPSGDALFFEGTSEDVRNIWRVTVEPKTLRWAAGPDRLTTGAERNTNISLSADGTRIAFSLRTEKTRLWSLPFDAIAGSVTGAGEPFTAEGADAPYDVSADGRHLVYRAIRQGKQELWERSLDNGSDRLLLAAGSISAPRWSPDGTRLVYRRDQPASRPGFPVTRSVAIMAANGEEKLLTTPRPMSASELMAPFDWSADGSKILSSCPTGPTGNMGVCLLSVFDGPHAERQMQVIASRPNHGLFEAQFSPDGRWVCFNAVTQPGISTVYVVPAKGGEWNAITAGRFWDDKPRWSPDGRTIYFTSTRAGFVNVWGRRFDPDKGTPLNEPFPVTTIETPSRMLLPKIRELHITLAHRRLILPIMDVSASIWVLDKVNQ
jgi:Tol biopolymer transport system component/DNA-binding winged helix-turn-helix (wHTH) protein